MLARTKSGTCLQTGLLSTLCRTEGAGGFVAVMPTGDAIETWTVRMGCSLQAKMRTLATADVMFDEAV